MNRRVLVTGASGFIGRYAVTDLVRRGYDVHATYVERRPPSNEDVTWHKIDLLTGKGVPRLLSRIRSPALVHLAWYAKHGAFWTAPENLDWVGASLALVKAFATTGGKRLVVAGSCAEYSWTGHAPLDERRTPLEPQTLYGASKDSLRRILEAYSKRANLSFAWGRVFFLFGPGEHPARFVSSVAMAMLRKDTARCSHGRQVRDFMHVEDVGAAFGALVGSDITGPINIATGRGVSLRAIARSLAKLIGHGDACFGAIEAAADDPPRLVARAQRIREELAFRPRYSLETGLRQMVDALGEAQ